MKRPLTVRFDLGEVIRVGTAALKITGPASAGQHPRLWKVKVTVSHGNAVDTISITPNGRLMLSDLIPLIVDEVMSDWQSKEAVIAVEATAHR